MKKLYIFVLILISLSSIPFSAQAADCNVAPTTADGYFFSNYESIEYTTKDGNPELIYHFKNQPRYSDGRGFTVRWNFVDDQCTSTAFYSEGAQGLSLPDGVTDWSAHVSRGLIEFYNDQTNTLIASTVTPYVPAYSSISIRGFIDGSASTLVSRTVKIDPSATAPVLTATLPTPVGCNAMQAQGYLYDTYEHAEYVDGLLRVHLRLKSPYNDGRFGYLTTVSSNSNCIPISAQQFLVSGARPFVRYYSMRMISPTDWVLWNDEWDTEMDCSNCYGTITKGSSFVQWKMQIDGGASTLQTTPFSPVDPNKKQNPVIIIPGILGSYELNGVWLIDPVAHLYDNLVDTFAANGYVKDKDLFTFPYDWRQSNVISAKLLKDKINQVKIICNCTKVDLVAHSMGGLVARQYIQSVDYQKDVNDLIFLGTPHFGSPKDYFIWEGGDFGPDLSPVNAILKSVLSLEAIENGYPNIFQYIHNKPILSVQELLPNYSYLFNENNSLKVYPTSYPVNAFLDNLKSTFSNLQLSGVNITNIVGNDQLNDTLESIDLKPSSLLPLWPEGMPTGLLQPLNPLGVNFGSGDQTVPLTSSKGQFSSSVVIASGHSDLPSEAEGLVLTTLTGISNPILVKKSAIDRILMFRIFSPADLTITDPDGRRIGRNGVEEINEIPDAFYTGFNTNSEFVVIPNPIEGNYQVQAKGTGNGGEYKIATDYISSGQNVEKDINGSIAPNAIVNSIVNYNSNNTDPIHFEPVDIDPPEIIVSSPKPNTDYLHSDRLQISVNISDNIGILSSVLLWDGQATTTKSIDLFSQTLGQHALTISAVDIAGNSTSTAILINVVTTPESTILDIDRLLQLGSITKKAVHDTLVQKINNAIKIDKIIAVLTEQLPGKSKVVKKIEKLVSRLDKILGVNIVKELDNQLGKGIDQVAYSIIRNDVMWLLAQ